MVTGGSKVSQQKRIGIFAFINIAILLFISFSTLYPFLYLIAVSFSPISEVMKSELLLFPKTVTLEAYQYVFANAGLANAYTVTICITVIGTLINLMMSSFGAYVLANKGVPGRDFFMTMIIITMVFSGGLIPLYLVVKTLHLTNSLWALMIPNAINTFWLIVMRNFFQSVPASLAESARIDGCSEFKILFTIILPLSLPILATLSLFYGVAHWNEYFYAIIYNSNPKLMPLQVLIRSMYESAITNLTGDALPPPVETVRAATIMVATLPILCIYPFLQRYFVGGIMVGAVKG